MTDRLKTVFRFAGGFVSDNTFGGEADNTMLGCQGLWVRANGVVETFSGVADFGEAAPIVNLGAGFTWNPPFLSLPVGIPSSIFEKGQWLLLDRNVVPVQRVVGPSLIELAQIPLPEPVSSSPSVSLLPIVVEVDDLRSNIARGSVIRYLSGTLLGVGYGRTYLGGVPVRSSSGDHFDLGKRMKIAIPDGGPDPSIFNIYDGGLPGFYPVDPTVTDPTYDGDFAVALGTDGKNAAGKYSIRLTRIRSATGGESNPTEPITFTLADNGSVTIDTSEWPKAWPGQTAWAVWITPEPLPDDSTDKPGPWYRWIAEDIPIAPDGTAPTRTFTWISQELEGSDLLEFDNDPPPDASFLAVLDDIVILCGTEGKPDPVTGLPTSPGPGCRPSKPLNPEAFPASYGTLVGPPEEIVGVVQGVGRIYLGTRNRVHIGTLTGNNIQPFQVRPFWHAGTCNSQQLIFVNGELYGYTGFGPTRSAGDGVAGSEEHLFGARVANVTRNWVRERVRVAYDPHRNAVVYMHTQDQKGPILLPDGTVSGPVWKTMCLPFMLDTQVWSGEMLVYDPFGLEDFNVSGAASVDGDLYLTAAGFNKEWDAGVFPGLVGYGMNTPFVDAGGEGLFKTLLGMTLTSHGQQQGLFIWRNNKIGSSLGNPGDLSFFPKDSTSVVIHPWYKLNARHCKTFSISWSGYWPGSGPRHEINEIAVESILERAHHWHMGLKSGISFSDIEPNVNLAVAGVGKIKDAFGEYASMSDTPDELAADAVLTDVVAAYNNLVRLWKKEQSRRRRAAIQMR